MQRASRRGATSGTRQVQRQAGTQRRCSADPGRPRQRSRRSNEERKRCEETICRQQAGAAGGSRAGSAGYSGQVTQEAGRAAAVPRHPEWQENSQETCGSQAGGGTCTQVQRQCPVNAQVKRGIREVKNAAQTARGAQSSKGVPAAGVKTAERVARRGARAAV